MSKDPSKNPKGTKKIFSGGWAKNPHRQTPSAQTSMQYTSWANRQLRNVCAVPNDPTRDFLDRIARHTDVPILVVVRDTHRRTQLESLCRTAPDLNNVIIRLIGSNVRGLQYKGQRPTIIYDTTYLL